MKKVLPLVFLFVFCVAGTAMAQQPNGSTPAAVTDTNVGISNIAPLYRLDVTTGVDNDGIRLRGINTGNLRLRLQHQPANKEFNLLLGGPASLFGNGNFVITDVTSLDSARLLINGTTGNIAIGGTNTNPAEKLFVDGTIGALGLKLANNAGLNRILASDAAGNATWQSAGTLNLTGGSGTLNFLSKWTPNGTSLGNSLLFDDGTYVGLGNTSPGYRFDLSTPINNDGLRVRGSNAGNTRFVLGNANAGKEFSMLVGGGASAYGNGNFAVTDMNNADSARLLINGTTGNVAIGGPTNPAEKLSVNGTVLATGLKIPTNAGLNKVLVSDAAGVATWQTANILNTVSGGGTLNSIPKWTPDGTTLGNSQLFDNGNAVGINQPAPQYRLDVGTSTNGDGLRVSGNTTGTVRMRLNNTAAGKEFNMLIGGSTSAYGNGNFVIVDATSLDSTRLAINGATGNVAIGGTNNPAPPEKLTVYGVTQTQGLKLPVGAGLNKILTSDANGNASWQAANAVNLLSGSGTLNYVTKWTPNGFTISNSQIVDDGTNVGIGNVSPLRKLDISSATSYTGINVTSPQIPSINLTATNGVNTGREVIRFGEGAFTPGGATVNAQIAYYRSAEGVNANNLVFSADNGGTRADLSISKTNNGNVGIGVINASQKLEVAGTVMANGLLIPTNAGTGKVLTSDASGNATWQTPAVTGSTSVIYSGWITSPYNSRDTTVDATCVRIRHIDAPSLSAAALSNAMVMVYMRVGSIGPYSLPYISDAGGATNQIHYILNQQKIFVYRHTFNTCRFNNGIPETYAGQPVLVNLPQSLEYRYVIITGTLAGGRIADMPALGANEHYAGSVSEIPDMGNAMPQGRISSTVER